MPPERIDHFKRTSSWNVAEVCEAFIFAPAELWRFVKEHALTRESFGAFRDREILDLALFMNLHPDYGQRIKGIIPDETNRIITIKIRRPQYTSQEKKVGTTIILGGGGEFRPNRNWQKVITQIEASQRGKELFKESS